MASSKRKPCASCGRRSYAVKTGLRGRFVCKQGLGCRAASQTPPVRTRGNLPRPKVSPRPRPGAAIGSPARPARSTQRGHRQVTWREHQQNRKPQPGCYCTTCIRKRKARTRRYKMGARIAFRTIRIPMRLMFGRSSRRRRRYRR